MALQYGMAGPPGFGSNEGTSSPQIQNGNDLEEIQTEVGLPQWAITGLIKFRAGTGLPNASAGGKSPNITFALAK